MKKLMLVAFLGLSACAQYPMQKPLAVDGTRNANFGFDETECRALAANYHPGKQGADIAYGAVSGAVTGWSLGEREDVVTGALGGAIVGAARGQYNDELIRRQVLVNCMQGRGHKVIG